MRRKIVAGNWKMNLTLGQAMELYKGISEHSISTGAELIVFPVALHAAGIIAAKGNIPVGLQNFYPEEKGAFTGEISVSQAADAGATYVLIGHSERRAIFGEDHSFLQQKVNAALKYGLTPVFCCGEPLELREIGKQGDFVLQQLEESLFHLSADDLKRCIIAYEPVWAIGTGRTATSNQAEEMHKAIRLWIQERYGNVVSELIPILYGGSCNPSNAKELFACPNVDGGLIGGASLDAASFISIAQSF